MDLGPFGVSPHFIVPIFSSDVDLLPDPDIALLPSQYPALLFAQ